MSTTQLVIAQVCNIAIALAIAGLLVRGHARFCRFFLTYLLSVLVIGLLTTFWPDRFYFQQFWILQHVVFDGLKLATVLELGYWIFLGFPGAAQTARGTLFLFLVATLVAVTMVPQETLSPDGTGWLLLGALRPRLETAIVFMFTAVAALVVWYRIPVYPVHLGIIIGFVPYLTVFTTVVRFLSIYGLDQRVTTLDPAAYLVACSWWAVVAWRRAPAVAPVIARLQPWRVAA